MKFSEHHVEAVTILSAVVSWSVLDSECGRNQCTGSVWSVCRKWSVFQRRSYSCGRLLRCSPWQNSCSETCSTTVSISLHVHSDLGSIWWKKTGHEISYLMFDLKDNQIQRSAIIQHYACSLCRQFAWSENLAVGLSDPGKGNSDF